MYWLLETISLRWYIWNTRQAPTSGPSTLLLLPTKHHDCFSFSWAISSIHYLKTHGFLIHGLYLLLNFFFCREVSCFNNLPLFTGDKILDQFNIHPSSSILMFRYSHIPFKFFRIFAVLQSLPSHPIPLLW